jgi:hypothetical protein
LEQQEAEELVVSLLVVIDKVVILLEVEELVVSILVVIDKVVFSLEVEKVASQ